MMIDEAEVSRLKAQASAADIEEAPPEYELPEAEPEGQQMETAELLAAVLSGAFGILTPNWGVSNNEIGQLSEHAAAVLDKYFPDGEMFNKFGAEIALVSTAAMVIAPRIGTPRKKPEPKKQVEKTKERGSAATYKPQNTHEFKMPEVINLD